MKRPQITLEQTKDDLHDASHFSTPHTITRRWRLAPTQEPSAKRTKKME